MKIESWSSISKQSDKHLRVDEFHYKRRVIYWEENPLIFFVKQSLDIRSQIE